MSLKELSTRHHAILNRLVIDGATPREVAGEFDMEESRLSVIRSSPLWKREEGRLRAELRSQKIDVAVRRLEGLVPDAVDALDECVNQEADPRLRLQSAKEILDRVGVGNSSITSEFKPVIQLYIPQHWNNKEGATIDIGMKDGD